MSPSPVGGWVFVKNQSMSESGCFIAARLDFEVVGLSTSLEPSGSIEGDSAFHGVLLKKSSLPTLHLPMKFFFMSFLFRILEMPI